MDISLEERGGVLIIPQRVDTDVFATEIRQTHTIVMFLTTADVIVPTSQCPKSQLLFTGKKFTSDAPRLLPYKFRPIRLSQCNQNAEMLILLC